MRKYDVVVIGAGPGMTAALYAARANLNVAMLDAVFMWTNEQHR